MLPAAFPPSASLVYWSFRPAARSRRAARAGVLAFPPAEAISALRVEGADVRRGHDQVAVADRARAHFAREGDLTLHGLRYERADARVIGGEHKVEVVRREHPGISRREDEEPSRCRMDRGARARQRGERPEDRVGKRCAPERDEAEDRRAVFAAGMTRGGQALAVHDPESRHGRAASDEPGYPARVRAR